MSETNEASSISCNEKAATNGTIKSTSPAMLLGRPVVVRALGTADAAGSGERSHKRSRPNDVGSGGGGTGGVRQVVRSMLRAHKLGVLVPLVYHADVVKGEAIMEAIEGRRLAELMADAAATAAAEEGGGSAAAPVAAAASAASRDTKPLPPDLDRAATLLGRTLATLHDGGQVHNNLSGTTVVIRESDGALVLTDFSRSFNSIVALDKAQDLVAFEAALLAMAQPVEPEATVLGAAMALPGQIVRSVATQVFGKVLASYTSSSRQWSATCNRLAEARNKAASRQQEPPQSSSKRPRTLVVTSAEKDKEKEAEEG